MRRTWKLLILVTSTLLLFTSSLQATIIDGIVALVNKEPITLYDIQKYATRFNLSKQEALDILIRQKLEESEIKKLDIAVDDFEVDQYIENIATKNGMSPFEFSNTLRSKNISPDEYKEDLRNKLKRDKLYRKILSSKTLVGDGELKAYYDANLHEFSQASAFNVAIYSSQNQQALEQITKNPMSVFKDDSIEEVRFETAKIEPKLAMLLNKTAENRFSDIIQTDKAFVVFLMKNKENAKTVSFDEAKNYIYNKLSEGKEQAALAQYFDKAKASAKIQVLRVP